MEIEVSGITITKNFVLGLKIINFAHELEDN